MVLRLFFCLALFVGVALAPMSGVRATDAPGRVTVLAAASLAEAMDKIAADFQAKTGHRVTVALAGSSALARQIQAGAPADLFVSANAAWMDVLDRDGLLAPGTRFDLAGNRLVLIGPAGPKAPADPVPLGPNFDLVGRLGQGGSGGRLAVALTRAVPAGIYAKAALDALGLWDSIAPHLAETNNVRAALTLVALGEAPLGIVYATDAAAEPRVTVIATFPADSHGPIVYPTARIGGRDNTAADAFLAWLKAPRTRAILQDLGFTPPPAATGD